MTQYLPKPRWRMLDILGVLLLVLGLILAAGSFAILRTMQLEQEARQRARQLADSRAAFNQLLTGVSTAESAQRGYLLTLSDAYLDPFVRARSETFALLDRLAAESPGPGPRASSLAELRALTGEKFAEMQNTIDLARAGEPAEARALVATDHGLQIMERLEALTESLTEIERQGMEASYAAVDRRRRIALLQIAVLVAGALAALLLAGFAMRQTAQAQAEAAWLDEIRAQRDRADLIRREMSHRIKNLFAVIMSIISTTARAETDPRAAARKTRERVQALARAHALSAGQEDFAGATFRALVEAVAGPYVPAGRDFPLQGPEIILSSQIITPLGLILNELATNATKYGGWAGNSGTVSMSWQLDSSNVLDFVWQETEIPPRDASPRRGFGTTMIDLSAQQVGGEVSREWRGTEFRFRMKVPLVELPADRSDKDRGRRRE